MKGFRQPAEANKKQQLRNVEKELSNLQMAGRISQMMTQQLLTNVKAMSDDLGSALNQLYELQYKYTALQKHLNLSPEALNEIANQQRLVDFTDASARQDVKDNLVEADVVGADSTVTITTTAKDETGADRGIFRSRIKLADCGVPDLITALTGKKVGDKVTTTLNQLSHEVELLSIRNPTLVVEVTADAAQAVEASH